MSNYTTLQAIIMEGGEQQLPADKGEIYLDVLSRYWVRSKSMCFDSLNSSDIACDEYASRTLAGKQAPSMAKTTAIDTKQCRRAKPRGSPALA